MGMIIPILGIDKVSIADALFSKAQQSVLGLLYGQPDKEFYTNEIIRLTKVGTGAIQRELHKLTLSGLVTTKRVGNQKYYQANKDSFVFEPLHDIVIKTFGLADILREALAPLSSKITISFIYGSVAKKEDTVDSDIDLMIIGHELTYKDLFQILTTAESLLGQKINLTIYTSTEWEQKRKAKNNFICKVISQPKLFILGEENFKQNPKTKA